MSNKVATNRATSTVMLLLFVFILSAGSALSAEGIDSDADEILRSMSTFLGGLSAFSVNADVDAEIIDMSGQKLQLSSAGTLVVQRPGKLYARRRGPVADMKFFFDGKVMTLYGNKLNVYMQIDSPGSIDNALKNLSAETGLDMPAADLFYADSYAGLLTDVRSGVHLGMAFVNGVECHYLAFRAAKVDWQIWVRAGDTPLPMKYIITTKWTTGAPQYSIRFRDWNTSPKIDPGRFTFSTPEGARRLMTIPFSETGELIIEEVQ